MSKYLLFNVGCIECGVSSNVVGVFESREVAEKHQKTLDHDHGWREGGQNNYEVFELPEPGVITEEYREVIGPVIEGDRFDEPASNPQEVA
jgi:hypothetical protein